jgi:hypothetical protein
LIQWAASRCAFFTGLFSPSIASVPAVKNSTTHAQKEGRRRRRRGRKGKKRKKNKKADERKREREKRKMIIITLPSVDISAPRNIDREKEIRSEIK